MHKNKFKLGLIVIAAVFANHAYAIADGAYLGIQAGLSKAHYKTQIAQFPSGTVLAQPKNNGFGGRVFGGYQFNPYAGVEAGLMRFSETRFDVPNSVATCSEPTIRVTSIDIMGKGIWPAFGDFTVFGKAGVALTFLNKSKTLITGTSSGCSSKKTSFVAHPIASIGAGYALSQNWEVDLSWTRLFGGGQLSATDLYAVGFSYHFVDKYCGQFLC